MNEAVQLTLAGGPEPRRPQIEAVDGVRRVGRGLPRRGDGRDATAERNARLQQHLVADTLALQQVGSIQATQSSANDGNVCGLHGYTPAATSARWPVLR